MLNQNLQTSVTSEKMCKENGGHLAMIDSKQEEADILKILEIHGKNVFGQLQPELCGSEPNQTGCRFFTPNRTGLSTSFD